MSGSNNLSYSHWKPNLSLIGNNGGAPGAASAAANQYQNIMKLAGSAVTGGVIHQHHSSQHSEDHLIPAHSAHSPHSMSRIIASPGSSNSLYSPGSSASSSTAPPQIPRAHQHNVPMSIIQQSPGTYADQNHHLDVYSQIGMQRIGQMFKANLMANNNNNNTSNCNNKNPKSNRPPQNYENTMKMEQSMNNIKQLVESAIGIEAKQQIMHILEKISLLQPPERLLLYLRMPSSTSDTDPLRQPQNPLGTRSEINFTINWVRSHLEMDPNVSIPKQDVYDEYTAFCAREDVKPLSTADFGKVMKQIFPSIRPRRLGTRGNSRYCYAAMRKTTKLECPQLPNLGNTEHDSSEDPSSANSDGGGGSLGGVGSPASWNIIKSWAANLLSTDFKNPHELADHISANYMSGSPGTISNSSRALLQKKLLQRKVKGRKKKSMSMSDDATQDGKKRRKKRLKKLLGQSSVDANDAAADHNDSPASISTANETNVPDEHMQIKQEQKDAKTTTTTTTTKPASQAMPMNLTNEHGKVKSEVDSLDYGTSPMAAESIELPDYSDTVCKIEIDEPVLDAESQAIYCKKVRRAKGLSISLPSPSAKLPSPESKPADGALSPASMLMRPPLTEAPTDLSVSSSEGGEFDVPNTNLLHVPPYKRNSFGAGGRIKKLRFHKHASVAGMNETKVDDIESDIIIPRERVVSICNMDKDALDDYLNEGGDSQEQEAELLQYFQTHDKSSHTAAATMTAAAAAAAAAAAHATVSTGNGMNTSSSSSTSSSTTNAAGSVRTTAAAVTPMANDSTSATAYPNYQLQHGNSATASGSNSDLSATTTNAPPRKQDQDQINELRQYLQQNLHHQPVIQSNMMKSAEDRHVTSSSHNMDSSGHFHGHSGWKNSGGGGNSGAMHLPSASDSLTALSLPYQNQQASTHDHHQNTENTSMPGPESMGMMRGSASNSGIATTASTGSIIHHSAQQSPNSRSKNFNFVPINSPGPQSPRVGPMQSNMGGGGGHAGNGGGRNTFLSPRRSPAVRKLVNRDLLKSLQDPSISTFDTAFKNEISASAPVSPSMTPHHFQFNTGQMSCYPGTSCGTTSISSTNPAAPHQHQASCSISGMCPLLERSHSVPLHCQSPSFNDPSASNTAYNSMCNSVAQTPVPSEYADFNDDNFMMEMFAESSSDHMHKMNETNDMHSMMSGTDNCIRTNFSRSVPSTPLPMHGFHSNPLHSFGSSSQTPVSTPSTGLLMMTKTHFDNSKSVPTTPNLLIHQSTPFRYSPEQHRDFLINGNTIDGANKANQFYAIQSTAATATTVTASGQTHQQRQQQQPLQLNAPPEQHASVSSTQSSAHVLLTATSTQPIEDLPNYSDVNDPIIEGSHLMNNL